MNRRRFLRVSGGGFAVASAGLAGCLGSLGLGDGDDPPPRDAEVFEDVSIEGQRMVIDLVGDPTVESRKDNVDGSAVVAALLPIGTARAGSRSSGSKSGTSGATGRGSDGYSSAPKDDRTGWAVYGGHSHGHRHDHEDEASTYRASIAALGVAYVGSNAAYQRESPGPDWGRGDWDEKWPDPEPGATAAVDLATLTDDSVSSLETGLDSDSGSESGSGTATGNETDSTAGNESESTEGADGSGAAATADEGWYRVGVHLESPSGEVDFQWEAADFRLERRSSGELAIDEAWHVRPRL